MERLVRHPYAKIVNVGGGFCSRPWGGRASNCGSLRKKKKKKNEGVKKGSGWDPKMI